MKNWKAKTIIAGTILLLIVASVYYYIALPAINIQDFSFQALLLNSQAYVPSPLKIRKGTDYHVSFYQVCQLCHPFFQEKRLTL